MAHEGLQGSTGNHLESEAFFSPLRLSHKFSLNFLPQIHSGICRILGVGPSSFDCKIVPLSSDQPLSYEGFLSFGWMVFFDGPKFPHSPFSLKKFVAHPFFGAIIGTDQKPLDCAIFRRGPFPRTTGSRTPRSEPARQPDTGT